MTHTILSYVWHVSFIYMEDTAYPFALHVHMCDIHMCDMTLSVVSVAWLKSGFICVTCLIRLYVGRLIHMSDICVCVTSVCVTWLIRSCVWHDLHRYRIHVTYLIHLYVGRLIHMSDIRICETPVCVTWLIQSCVLHDSQAHGLLTCVKYSYICVTSVCVTWRIQLCVWHDPHHSLIHVTCLIDLMEEDDLLIRVTYSYVWHPYVWHDSSRCGCDMTLIIPRYVSHVLFTCIEEDDLLTCVTYSYVWHLYVWHPYVWHDSSRCVCDRTRIIPAYMWHALVSFIHIYDDALFTMGWLQLIGLINL